MYRNRIRKELEKLTGDKDADIGIYKVFEDTNTFYAFIRGPSDSPFEGGYFKIFVHLKDDYPFSPPYMKFMTKIYHPNISSQTGTICLDILKDKWTAAMNLTTALLSVEALLTAAVPEDPQDYPVAVVYTEDRKKYDEEAKRWTQEYATEAVTDNEKLIESLLKRYDKKAVMNRLSMNIWDEKRLEKLLDKEAH